MPSITRYKSGGGVIRYDGDDWLSQLIPQWSNSSGLYRKATGIKGLSFMRGMDPHRIPGYMMPGPYGVDMSNVSTVTSMIKNAVVNGQYSYPIGGTRIQQLDLSNDTLTNSGSFPKTIAAHGGHSGVVAQDIALYYIGTTPYAFYSWNDGSDGDVGRFNLNSTFYDDWLSNGESGSNKPANFAALDTTNPHPLAVGNVNYFLYIADGRNIHALDGTTGTNGTLTKNVFTLPRDYVTTSFAQTADYLVIYAYKASGGASFFRSEATAFFWDYFSSKPTKVIPLNGNYVNGGFNYGSTVGCFVQGRSSYPYANKLSSLLLFDGSKFQTVATFTDNIPEHGGVEVSDEVIYWNSSGVIYRYGTPHPGYKAGLSRISEVIGGTTTGGMLKNLAGSGLYVSAGTDTNGGLQKLSTGYYFQSIFATPSVAIPTPRDYKAQIDYVRVYWGETTDGTGQTFSLGLSTNRGGSVSTVLSNHSTITNLVTTHNKLANGAGLPRTDTIGLQCSYASGVSSTAVPPYVEAIEIYFSDTKI